MLTATSQMTGLLRALCALLLASSTTGQVVTTMVFRRPGLPLNNPQGLAIDISGNLLIADSGNNKIRVYNVSTGWDTILAGGGGDGNAYYSAIGGSADGTGTNALFNGPRGLAVSKLTGNVLVTDSQNYKIRSITPNGTVTTFAGGGSSGTSDGTGTLAKFSAPLGIALDSYDNAFVADGYAIRRVSASGIVSTFAGGSNGGIDGVGTSAQFGGLWGIVCDSLGNIFVSDTGNWNVRRITSSGLVSTFAGGVGSQFLFDKVK
jgi:DNA-binding beta-propeller fold protein YncE